MSRMFGGVAALALCAMGMAVMAGGPPKVLFEGSGVLSIGPQGCPGFVPDDVDALYLIEDTGGFLPGDHVYVTGSLNQLSTLCPPVLFPGIESNTIARFVEGCATIGPGPQSCLNVQLDTGETFFYLGLVQLPDDIGFGDELRVRGFVVEETNACFPIIGTGLNVTEIGPCIAGDVNIDGVVDFSDLTAMLSGWGPCPSAGPCRADVDDSNGVGFADLSALLSNWTG